MYLRFFIWLFFIAIVNTLDYVEDDLSLLHHHLVTLLSFVRGHLSKVFVFVGTCMMVMVRLLSALLLPFLVKLIFLLMLVFLLIQTFSCPTCDDKASLFLTYQDMRASWLFDDVFVLLGPLTIHLTIKIGGELILYLLLLQNTFDQSFENINVVDLLGCIRMHLDLEIFQEL